VVLSIKEFVLSSTDVVIVFESVNGTFFVVVVVVVVVGLEDND